MPKRKNLWIGSIIWLVVACLVGIYLAFATFSFTLTGEEIQTKINSQLPKKKDGVTAKSVIVELRDNAVFVTVDIEGRKFGQNFSLTANAVGIPRYDQWHHQFYFDPTNIQIEDFKREGQSVGEKITGFVDRHTHNQKLRNLAAKIAPDIEEWVLHKAEKGVETALKRMPIYHLKDDTKGYIAQAMLDSVQVVDDHLVVNLSLYRLTLSVIVCILCVLAGIGMIGVLIMFPELGMITMILP